MELTSFPRAHGYEESVSSVSSVVKILCSLRTTSTIAVQVQNREGEPGGSLCSAYSAYSAVSPSCLRMRHGRDVQSVVSSRVRVLVQVEPLHLILARVEAGLAAEHVHVPLHPGA